MNIGRIDLRKDNRGIALITVLIIMLVMTILSTGVIIISVSNLKQTKTTLDHNQSFYVAEAGVNYMVKKLDEVVDGLIANNTPIESIFDEVENEFRDGAGSVTLDLDLENETSGNFVAVLTVNKFAKTINIKSTGTVDGVSRTVIKEIKFGGISINRAILTEGILNIGKDDIFADPSKNADYGEVQTLLYGEKAFSFNNNANIGVVYIPLPTPLTNEEISKATGCLSTKISQTANPLEYKCTTDFVSDGYFLIRIDDTGIESLPEIKIPDNLPTKESATLDAKVNQVHVKNGNKWSEQDASVYFIDNSHNMNITSSAFENRDYVISNGGTPGYSFNFPTDTNKFYIPNFNVFDTVDGFTINVGARDIKVFSDNIDLRGTFNITGTGSLTIVVNKVESFNYLKGGTLGALKLGDGDPKVANKFIVIIDSDQSGALTLGSANNSNGNTIFYLSLLTTLNLVFEENGNVIFYGFLATNGESIEFSGSLQGNLLLYAPNANVSVAGSTAITGAIYANQYTGNTNGNAVKVYFDKAYSKTPFSFLSPLSNVDYGPTVEE